MRSPWVIHEAEIALYPAWQDGTPYAGPGLVRGDSAPVFQCKSSLSISESRRKSAVTGHSWTGAEVNAESEWEISASFPDGVMHDGLSRVLSRLAPGGFHILVARYLDAASGEWSLFQWFFVTCESDDGGESGELVSRVLRLKSTWMQESAGSASLPPMRPVVVGEVDWICGTQRITAMTYDPDGEAWTSLPRNETGDAGTRYVNIAPVQDSTTDVAIAAYFPRFQSGAQVAPALPRASIVWQNLVVARIGNHASLFHHGLVVQGRLAVQAEGIVEPLLAYPQSRMLDEPVIVFRYLRRIYAVIGHGRFCVPRLVLNEDPPASHDYPFRLAIPGEANPATGQSGMILRPDGAWLDGTVTEIA